jgi:hypothetical protein
MSLRAGGELGYPSPSLYPRLQRLPPVVSSSALAAPVPFVQAAPESRIRTARGPSHRKPLERRLNLDQRTSLLDVLRENLGLTCGHGNSGRSVGAQPQADGRPKHVLSFVRIGAAEARGRWVIMTLDRQGPFSRLMAGQKTEVLQT